MDDDLILMDFSNKTIDNDELMEMVAIDESEQYVYKNNLSDWPFNVVITDINGVSISGRAKIITPEGMDIVCELKNGQICKETVKSERIPENGIINYLNGNVFNGKTYALQPDEGVMKYIEGHVFEGKFKKGEPYYGICKYSDGSEFFGEFKDGIQWDGDLSLMNSKKEHIQITEGKNTLKYYLKNGIKCSIVYDDNEQPTSTVYRSSGKYILTASGARNNNYNKIDYNTGNAQGELWLMNEDFSETYCIITFNSRGEPVKVKNYDAKKPFLEEESLLALYNKVPMIYTTLISKDIPKQDKSKKKENKKVDNKANLDLDKNNKKGSGKGGGINA